MGILLSMGVGLFILAILAGLTQLWLVPWSFEVFLKLEMTLGALFLIACIIWFVVKEYREDIHNRNGDKLDD
jgi:hypothetical protein